MYSGKRSWCCTHCPPSERLHDDNCGELKARLESATKKTRLMSRTRSRALKHGNWTVATRMAVEELEAWYFGDWQAVCLAYPRTSRSICNEAKYRRSDEISGGTWEAFERVMRRAGYFEGGLRKIEAAREIAVHMDPSRNSSASFRSVRDVLKAMVSE